MATRINVQPAYWFNFCWTKPRSHEAGSSVVQENLQFKTRYQQRSNSSVTRSRKTSITLAVIFFIFSPLCLRLALANRSIKSLLPSYLFPSIPIVASILPHKNNMILTYNIEPPPPCIEKVKLDLTRADTRKPKMFFYSFSSY